MGFSSHDDPGTHCVHGRSIAIRLGLPGGQCVVDLQEFANAALDYGGVSRRTLIEWGRTCEQQTGRGFTAEMAEKLS